MIVTSWKPEDLIAGSSELSLYPFCKESDITLYINNRIHLKVYSKALDDVILATSNISQRGLGTIPRYNFECATLLENLSSDDRLYLAQVQKDAIHVDDELYHELSTWYEKQEKKKQKKMQIDEIIPLKTKESFLISALPMTKSVELLEDVYQKFSKGIRIKDVEVRDCVFHDLANYSIELGLSKNAFRKKLISKFFKHPFIKKIDEFIDPEAYFGRIKEWVQKNCTDVPIPSRRELTGNVQVLLEWFEKLGNGKYVIDIPGARSQRIRKTTP